MIFSQNHENPYHKRKYGDSNESEQSKKSVPHKKSIKTCSIPEAMKFVGILGMCMWFTTLLFPSEINIPH